MTVNRFVQADIPFEEITGAHPGGMTMDDGDLSEDRHEDPFIIARSGARLPVSREDAHQALRHIDEFGTPGG